MKQQPERASGYLGYADGAAWTNVLAAIPDSLYTDTDYGDRDYLKFGKGYWVSGGPTQNWGMYQTFLRFDLSAVHAHEAIEEATLRLYVATGPETDCNMLLRVLAASYGTLDKTDWDASGTSITFNTSDIVSASSDYIDIALSTSQIALLTAGSTVDMMLRHHNQTTEPTDLEMITAYGDEYEPPGLRPHLYLKTKPQREIIIEALFTTLSTIDAFNGYNYTYPTTSRRWKPLEDLNEALFPAIMYSEDSDLREWEAVATDTAAMEITVGVAVFNIDRGELMPDLNRAIDDVERCIDLNRKLGLGDAYSNIIRFAGVSRVETDEDFVIEECRAFAFVTVRVGYPRRHRRA